MLTRSAGLNGRPGPQWSSMMLTAVPSLTPPSRRRPSPAPWMSMVVEVKNACPMPFMSLTTHAPGAMYETVPAQVPVTALPLVPPASLPVCAFTSPPLSWPSLPPDVSFRSAEDGLAAARAKHGARSPGRMGSAVGRLHPAVLAWSIISLADATILREGQLRGDDTAVVGRDTVRRHPPVQGAVCGRANPPTSRASYALTPGSRESLGEPNSVAWAHRSCPPRELRASVHRRLTIPDRRVNSVVISRSGRRTGMSTTEAAETPVQPHRSAHSAPSPHPPHNRM